MSDEDSLDELLIFKPKITKKGVSMPRAEELAEQRAHELQFERELSQLSADDVRLSDSDSFEREAPSPLEPTVETTRAALPSLAELMCALAPHLPADAQAFLGRATARGALGAAVAGAGALVARGEEVWSPGDALGVGALLAAAALAHDAPRAARAPALRALHALLNWRATEHQATELVRALMGALAAPRGRLELSDALRGGGGARTDRLADFALDAALAGLFDVQFEEDGRAVSLERVADAVQAHWSRLSAPAAYLALQLLARRLAAARARDGAARARLLRALRPAARGRESQRPDVIKVTVAASRLEQFFRADE